MKALSCKARSRRIASGLVVEPTQDHVLDTGPGQPYDRLDGAGRHLRVDDNGQRRVPTANVLERFDFDLPLAPRNNPLRISP